MKGRSIFRLATGVGVIMIGKEIIFSIPQSCASNAECLGSVHTLGLVGAALIGVGAIVKYVFLKK